MSGAPPPARDARTGLPGRVTVAADLPGVALAAARWLLAASSARTDAGGEAHVALPGGSTPAAMYDLLSGPLRAEARWDRWHVWFGDERAVSPDDEHSNFHLADRRLLSRVPVRRELVHRIEAERPDLDAVAAAYSSLLAEVVPTGAHGPRLDAVLLGLGENGHTASLFPGDPSLEVTDALAARSRADYWPYDRVTLTFPALNAGAAVAFALAGASKAGALRGVVDGTVPAARVRPLSGELDWFIDEAAAAAMAAGGAARGHARLR